MRITFKQLNESFNALARLVKVEFPKDSHKLAYKLSRIWKSAKSEIEEMQAGLRNLAQRHGITPGTPLHVLDPEKREDYSWNERQFLKDTDTEIWGDPFLWSELRDHVDLTAADMADLDWLIIFDIEDETRSEPEKADSAQV